MIILERSSYIVFSVYSLSSLKTYLNDWEKKLYSPRLMFNKLTKLTKILTRKNQCCTFCFVSVGHFISGIAAVLRFLVSIKYLEPYKKLPWDKYAKKKRTFSQKNLYYVKFFRITMFSWWFSWFLRTINLYQCLITFIIWWSGYGTLEHEKKHFTVYTYFVFSKNSWLKLMTCNYTCRE